MTPTPPPAGSAMERYLDGDPPRHKYGCPQKASAYLDCECGTAGIEAAARAEYAALRSAAAERDEIAQYRTGHLPTCGGVDEIERRCACGYLQGEAYRDLLAERDEMREALEAAQERLKNATRWFRDAALALPDERGLWETRETYAREADKRAEAALASSRPASRTSREAEGKGA